jgi:outer membrane protein TolC
MPEDSMPGLSAMLKTAMERSPTMIASSIALAQAEAGVYVNEAQLWPGVSAFADYAVTRQSITSSASSTSTGLFYNLSVSQPLFQWGAYKNQADIGKLAEKVAEKQFAEAYRGLAISIREQFLALIGKKIALRNALFSLKIQKESQVVAQAKFDAGNLSSAELDSYKIDVEQSQLNADRAAEDYGYAKRILTRLIGSDLPDESVPSSVPHPEFSAEKADAILAGFVGSGIESTFQSQVYKLLIEQQDKNYKIAKVRLLPKFSASASINYSNYVSTNGVSISQIGVQSENYSVAASWAIFDGFATKGSKLSALAAKRTYQQQEQAYIDQSVDQIADMRKQLGFSARAMALSEVHNALIAAEVKRLGEDKNLGFASQATIDAGVLNLYSTEFNMTFARNDYLGRWVEFVSLAGIDPALQNLSSRYVR